MFVIHDSGNHWTLLVRQYRYSVGVEGLIDTTMVMYKLCGRKGRCMLGHWTVSQGFWFVYDFRLWTSTQNVWSTMTACSKRTRLIWSQLHKTLNTVNLKFRLFDQHWSNLRAYMEASIEGAGEHVNWAEWSYIHKKVTFIHLINPCISENCLILK